MEIHCSNSNTQGDSEELSLTTENFIQVFIHSETSEQEETNTFCAAGPSHSYKQLQENVLASRSKATKCPQNGQNHAI